MRTEWKLFWFYLLFIALITKPYPYGENEGSRFNAIASIVEDHTLGWTSAYFVTDDRIRVNGIDYSDKPYTFVLLTSPLYFLLDHVGIRFSTYLGWSTYLLKVLVVGVGTALLLVLFYRALELEQKHKIILTLILGFCTLLLSYGTAFNNHSISALLLFGAFVLYRKGTKPFFLGSLLGLLTDLDLIIGAFFTFAIFCSFFLLKEPWADKRTFLLGFFLLFSLQMISNYAIVGDPFFPAYAHPQYYIDAGTWQHQGNLPGFYNHESFSAFLTYAFHSTFGFRGFFAYSPILFFGFCALLWNTFRKKELRLLPFVFGIIATLLYYSLYTVNYGGSSYATRYFIPLIPILVYFCADILISRYRKIFYIAAFFSFIFSLVGAFNPWANHMEQGLYAISFFVNFDYSYAYNTAGHYVVHEVIKFFQ